MNIDIEGEPEFITENKLEEIAKELENILDQEYQNLCNEIYKDLKTKYDYLTSDEYIKKYLIDNKLWNEPEPKLSQNTPTLKVIVD